jgi:hypothetical protein
MGRIISRAIDTVGGALFREKRKTGSGKRSFANDFLSKKKLAMICDFRHTSRSCGDDESS